jgi:alanyl-tRNA synthetase
LQTEKLYYLDPYLQEFPAAILRKTALADGRFSVVLDRTAFYPEGGGQPCDTGTLNELPVLAVQTKDGEIVHTVDGDPGDGPVVGKIDWRRRFDHMQQHTGEHILSGVFLAKMQAENVGFHLSAATVQIDVTLPALSAELADEIETAANAVIFANQPIEAKFVEIAELAAYALRKAPGAEFEQIRLVSIADCDCCPCGGTHLRRTGEVGLLKILGWEKRKNNIRVEFACGHRALADYRLKHELARALSSRFSAPVELALPAFERFMEKQEFMQRELSATRKAYHEELATRLLSEAAPVGGIRIVSRAFAGYGAADLQDFAARITTTDGAVCLLAAVDETAGRSSFLFAAAADVPVAMNDLLKRSLAPVSGKGGGNAATAQGGAPIASADPILATARTMLTNETAP